MADLGLADAVNTPEALLDPVRVPRQVVVDHQMRAALQVRAFARGIGRRADARDVIVTKNEILASLNAPDAFHLALVMVEAGFAHQPVYVQRFFRRELGFVEVGCRIQSCGSFFNGQSRDIGRFASTATEALSIFEAKL